jgi:hypothetical protein
MLSEDEKNLNCLRGIIGACEEGANDELCDGSDGNEPWTEEDRRNSRETADRLRALFFEAPKLLQPVRSAKKKPAPSGKQLFTDDELWAELERPDDRRRQSAVIVMDALCELAQVRAKLRGTSFLQERRTIFDVDRLLAEMRTHEGELYEAAFRAWNEVCQLSAIRDAEHLPSTEEDRRWAEEVVSKLRAKIEEWRRTHPPTEAEGQ